MSTTKKVSAPETAAPSRITVTAQSLIENMPKREVADFVQSGWQDIATIAANDVFKAVCNMQVKDLPKDREGRPQLAFTTRDGRTYMHPAGNMLKGMVKSALISAFFESESGARAWNAYANEMARLEAKREADAQGVDGVTPGDGVSEDSTVGSDRLATRAQEGVTSACIASMFAAQLAVIVETLGDGEPIEATYTPRAGAGGNQVVPAAAKTLSQFLKG